MYMRLHGIKKNNEHVAEHFSNQLESFSIVAGLNFEGQNEF